MAVQNTRLISIVSQAKKIVFVVVHIVVLVVIVIIVGKNT